MSIWGRTITNFRFADNIDGLAGEEEELANVVQRFDKASKAYGMEISAEKTKLMTNNTSGINTEIKVNGQKLETVTNFKYLGSVITDEGSKPEILSRIAQTTATLTMLKPVLNDTLQWGVADTEIKVPSDENTELKHSRFKAWSRSIYSHTCYAYCQGFLPCLFLPSGTFTCIFSKTSPNFFLCWLWLTPVPV